MRLLARAFTALCCGIFAFSAAPAAVAEEGMWTFNNFPTERMQAALGWAPDQAWLNRVMQGTARMPADCKAAPPGCTARPSGGP